MVLKSFVAAKSSITVVAITMTCSVSVLFQYLGEGELSPAGFAAERGGTTLQRVCNFIQGIAVRAIIMFASRCCFSETASRNLRPQKQKGIVTQIGC